MNRLYLVASALIAIAMVGFAQPSGARALQHHAHRHHGIQLVRAAAHDRVPVRSERPVPARDGSRDRPHRRATMPRLTHRGTSHRGFAKYGSRHATNAPSHDSRQHDAGTRIGVQSAIPVRSPQTQVISGRGPPPHHVFPIATPHPRPSSPHSAVCSSSPLRRQAPPEIVPIPLPRALRRRSRPLRTFVRSTQLKRGNPTTFAPSRTA